MPIPSPENRFKLKNRRKRGKNGRARQPQQREEKRQRRKRGNEHKKLLRRKNKIRSIVEIKLKQKSIAGLTQSRVAAFSLKRERRRKT